MNNSEQGGHLGYWTSISWEGPFHFEYFINNNLTKIILKLSVIEVPMSLVNIILNIIQILYLITLISKSYN